MAIEFTHRGKRWRADTAKEAMELRQKLEHEDFLYAQANPDFKEQLIREQTLWTLDKFWELVNSIGDAQKRFLETLARKDRVTSIEMAEALRLDSQIALAGVVSGLSKQLRGMGFSPTVLYKVDTQWHKKKKERTFSLLPGFKSAAEDAGWPDDWKNKPRKETDAASTKKRVRK